MVFAKASRGAIPPAGLLWIGDHKRSR